MHSERNSILYKLRVAGAFADAAQNSHFKSRCRFESWQRRMVHKHLEHVERKSDFYRDEIQRAKSNALQDLPIMTKALMMENFERINTAKISKAECLSLAIAQEKSRDFTARLGTISVGLSTGTSGSRGIFIFSEEERALWAGNILFKVLGWRVLTPQRIALVYRSNSNLYTGVCVGRLSFRYFDLLNEQETIFKDLETFAPTVLVGPPSLLRMVAEAIENKVMLLQPNWVFSAGETLETLDRAKIESAFRRPLGQIYQATEGFLGITCRANNLHLNEDGIFVEKEYLDHAKSRFVPIITDFRRISQPIIRYRLDDVLLENAGTCPCGSVFSTLAGIEGRCDDVFVLLRSDGSSVKIFPDFIRQCIAGADDSIQQYLVEQVSLHKIVVSAKSTKPLSTIALGIEDQLNRLLVDRGCVNFQIDIQPYNVSEVGKVRRVKRSFQVSV